MSKVVVLIFVLVFLTASLTILSNPVSSASTVENSWVEKAPLPSAESASGAAVVNNVIYVFGASDYSYNPSTDTWTTIAPVPTPRDSFAVAACDNKIFVIGGFTGNGEYAYSVNEVYDPSTNTWSTAASMTTARGEMNAATVDGKIYVMGGRTAQAGSTVNITEIYNPATDSWSKGASMPYPVVAYASAVLDDKIYIISGQDEYYGSQQNPNPNVQFTQIYNPATDSWSLGSPIPATAFDAGAGATTGLWLRNEFTFLEGR